MQRSNWNRISGPAARVSYMQYHCRSISADAAVCNAESMSELASQQQRMCRSLIRSVIRTLQAL